MEKWKTSWESFSIRERYKLPHDENDKIVLLATTKLEDIE